MTDTDRHPHPHSELDVRTAAVESLLVEKGAITSEQVDAVVEVFEQDLGPMNGARVVARAWVDDAYRQRLLTDGTAAIRELGFGGAEGNIRVVENTDAIHNVIVCTLCSCYPWPVLGLPPNWYKDFAYRSRVVREPRRVLAEMGLQLDDGVELRVWDSSAEIRYMVLPRRPPGTEELSEEQLATVVTRDGMIGVARV
ncbi:MAG: nitrile hydratase subunit alpha [Chloroflexi bacterium]|nr:MAG: nitrile hydratase subunit alpha [Chloroflexota bacterium]